MTVPSLHSLPTQISSSLAIYFHAQNVFLWSGQRPRTPFLPFSYRVNWNQHPAELGCDGNGCCIDDESLMNFHSDAIAAWLYRASYKNKRIDDSLCMRCHRICYPGEGEKPRSQHWVFDRRTISKPSSKTTKKRVDLVRQDDIFVYYIERKEIVARSLYSSIIDPLTMSVRLSDKKITDPNDVVYLLYFYTIDGFGLLSLSLDRIAFVSLCILFIWNCLGHGIDSLMLREHHFLLTELRLFLCVFPTFCSFTWNCLVLEHGVTESTHEWWKTSSQLFLRAKWSICFQAVFYL